MIAPSVARACLAVALLAPAPIVSAECMPVTTVSCKLKDMGDVVFAGTLVLEKDSVYHFKVEEPFKGVKAAAIDVLNFPVVEGGTGFNGAGKRYLVFATRMTLPDRSVVTYVGGCGYQMVELSSAGALLEQLRRQASGRRTASVFGRLTRQESGQVAQPEGPPVPNVSVRLKSPRHTYSGRTNADGSYAIDGVAAGTYELEADLPPGYEIGRINDDEAEPLEIEKHSCQVADAEAMPGGRISGRLIGPDGKPRHDTRVDLYTANFVKVGDYFYGGVTDGGTYTFPHLWPDDYVVVFGAENGIDPDNAFPRTFYRDSPDLEHATVIHLAAGQHILDADIRLPPSILTRQITVTIDWNGQAPANFSPGDTNIFVSVDAYVLGPRPRRAGPDRFVLNLMLDRSYSIHAVVHCRQPYRRVESEAVGVNGGDASVTEVTVRVPPRACGGE